MLKMVIAIQMYEIQTTDECKQIKYTDRLFLQQLHWAVSHQVKKEAICKSTSQVAHRRLNINDKATKSAVSKKPNHKHNTVCVK